MEISYSFFAYPIYYSLNNVTYQIRQGFKRSKAFTGPTGISPMHYLLTQFRVMVTYIRLVFLPLNQNLDYDYPISKSIFELPTLISFLFLISILFFAKRLFSKYRLVSFSIFWFFLTLLPESSLFPLKDVFLNTGFIYHWWGIVCFWSVACIIFSGIRTLMYSKNNGYSLNDDHCLLFGFDVSKE